MARPSVEQIIDAVLALVNAESKEALVEVIAGRPDALFTDLTAQVFAMLREHWKDNQDATDILEQRQTILADRSPERIKALLSDPSSLVAHCDFGMKSAVPLWVFPSKGELRRLRKLQHRMGPIEFGSLVPDGTPLVLAGPHGAGWRVPRRGRAPDAGQASGPLDAILEQAKTSQPVDVIGDVPADSSCEKAEPDAPGELASSTAFKPEPAAAGLPQSQAGIDAAQLSDPRYLNAGFFAEADQSLPTQQPLMLEGRNYRLGVNIGRFWGPGTPGTPIPADVLAPHLAREAVLTLDVVPSSPDVRLDPPRAKLQLPRSGDSGLVFFALRFDRDGRHALDVDLLFRGHLLQSRRTEVEVVANATVVLPQSAGPVQDGYVTFTRTALIAVDDVSDLQPSRLTIVVQRDRVYNRIGLRFYDASGEDLGVRQSALTDLSLGKVLKAARNQLAKTMNAYTGGVGSTLDVLQDHLAQLADIGASFYQTLLPALAENDQDSLRNKLVPGTTVQVAPLSAQVGVPWELLYERPIFSREAGRISLCSTFQTHGPGTNECPHHDDPTVVCPHGFWGYRYIIEQLPCRVDPHVPPSPDPLPLQIPNAVPSYLTAVVDTGFSSLPTHLEAIQALTRKDDLKLVRIDKWSNVGSAMRPPNVFDVVYFYTHGGTNELGLAYFTVGPRQKVFRKDLLAWKINLKKRKPLIVLNACESASYSPDSFENLIQFLCDKGAAGVIGTQCEVKEQLANAIMLRFLQTFLQEGPAGSALLDARRALLLESLDPRGLAYSLFAAADVKLAQPVAMRPE